MSQRRLTSSEPALSCLPYGVGQSGEGVALLVHLGPYRILLDCGLTELKPLKASKKPPADFVFCSHAHADHARGLLPLHLAFPQMPIYASEVTVQLLPLNWLTSNEESGDFCQSLPWRTPVDLAEDLTAEIFPAGHLPGAAAIFLSYKTAQRTYKLLYTGDFSLSNFQLVEGLSIEMLRGLAPDILIIEGSYGTQRHPHRRQQEKQLMNRIYRAVAEEQSVILPVPALGLGQEILKLLRSHHQFTGQDLDIWVHGHVATACDLYLDLMSEFPASVQNFAKHQPLFWDDRICPRLGRLQSNQMSHLGEKPCIILTDQIEHLSSYLQDSSQSWLILIPEHYPAPKNLPVETYLLAEHSDGRNTTQLIHNLRPQHIIFVHGSPNYLADLTSLEELQNRYQLHSPGVGTLVELPIGDRFLQPSPLPPSHYEGELNESATAVTITLSDAITTDPRWGHFADTGLVEARWQGEELLIKGISQRELLSDSTLNKRITDIDCCRTCRHQKSQRCWNPDSPLYGFKVIAEGYCPVFEPLDQEST